MGRLSPNTAPNDGASTVRVLVVEDYPPFLQCISSILGGRDDLQIVGKAADGLQAVQTAEELQPDLILLDIGLPTLNGIAAAHRISRVAPRATVLFLSQEIDPDVVAAALRNGAKGYVYKQNAKTDLLPAIEAVLRGDHFVSTRLDREEQGGC
jgi:DNA-binding NarL/FixJ family response regulator